MTGKIREHILAVRDDGRVNMFDVPGVQWVANDLNLFELVIYLDDRENWKEYSRFIMTGEAEITDDDSTAPEDEEDPDIDPDDDSYFDCEADFGPPPTREEMKAEAVHRLKLLNLDPEIIRQFEENGEIYSCVGFDGHPVPADDFLKASIRQLEATYGFMVFLNIHAEMCCDSMDSLLIVSKYREEWEMETMDIQDGYAMTYTINQSHDECSEMGSIALSFTKTGGIIRTA